MIHVQLRIRNDTSDFLKMKIALLLAIIAFASLSWSYGFGRALAGIRRKPSEQRGHRQSECTSAGSERQATEMPNSPVICEHVFEDSLLLFLSVL